VQSPARAVLAAACSIHFVHDGFSDILYVLLPLWATEFRLTFAQVGIIRTAYSGGMARSRFPRVCSPRRWGERRLLAAGTAVTACGFIAAGTVGGFLSLLSVLLVAGLGSGVQHPLSSSLVAKAYETGARRAALGTYNSGDLGKVAVPAAVALVAVAVAGRTASAAYGMVGLAAALAILGCAGPAHHRTPEVMDDRAAEPRETHSGWGIRDPRGFRALTAIGMIDNATRTGFLTFLAVRPDREGLLGRGRRHGAGATLRGRRRRKFACASRRAAWRDPHGRPHRGCDLRSVSWR